MRPGGVRKDRTRWADWFREKAGMADDRAFANGIRRILRTGSLGDLCNWCACRPCLDTCVKGWREDCFPDEV